MHSLSHDLLFFLKNEITPKCSPTFIPLAQLPLVAFQVSSVLFSLQLFRTGTASVSVSAAAAVVGSAAAHLVPTVRPSARLSAAAGLSSGFSCCWCSLNKMRTLIPARSRMLKKTLTIFRTSFDGVRPPFALNYIITINKQDAVWLSHSRDGGCFLWESSLKTQSGRLTVAVIYFHHKHSASWSFLPVTEGVFRQTCNEESVGREDGRFSTYSYSISFHTKTITVSYFCGTFLCSWVKDLCSY